MSRLFTQVQDNDKIVVILTAFRSERTLQENRALNKQLASDLRSLG
jgi:hypothetical protein